MKLLLADDDLDQVALRRMTLARAGFEVCTAGDVQTAVLVAASEAPAVAVVDLKLPTVKAGLELIRGLKKLDPSMRVIVLTGSDPAKLEKMPERALIEAVFIKGDGSRQLVAHLKRASNLKRAAEAI